MSFEILVTDSFEKSLKKIAKKHKSVKEDLRSIVHQLRENLRLGTPLGKDCYKIRFLISSKGRGKSGGARIITPVKFYKSEVYL